MFFLTNILVKLMIVEVLLQGSAVTALTSAVCEIPARFRSRVIGDLWIWVEATL